MHTLLLKSGLRRRITEADWPRVGSHAARFGPSVQAWIGLLSGAYRIRASATSSPCSPTRSSLDLAVKGSVSQLEQHVSEALAAPVEDALRLTVQATSGGAASMRPVSWVRSARKRLAVDRGHDLVTVFAHPVRAATARWPVSARSCPRRHHRHRGLRSPQGLRLLARVAAPGLLVAPGAHFREVRRPRGRRGLGRPAAWVEFTHPDVLLTGIAFATARCERVHSCRPTSATVRTGRFRLRLWQGLAVGRREDRQDSALNLAAIEPAFVMT